MTSIQKFQKSYITSSEISQRLGITPNGVNMARRRGVLPKGIRVGNTYIYERGEVEAIIQNWTSRHQ